MNNQIQWQDVVANLPSGSIAIGVSKRQPIENVHKVVDAGCHTLGENYVEGLVERRQQFPDIELHYIGALQSRKIETIVENADFIHTLTRVKEAKIAQAVETKLQTKRQYLMQINIGDEPQKNGVPTSQVIDTWRSLRESAPLLNICGLMMIGPTHTNPEDQVQDFDDMGKFRNEIQAFDSNCRHLSMGMSHDWQVALQHGATMVRIGQALFGTRE